jgi:hypothetical protein
MDSKDHQPESAHATSSVSNPTAAPTVAAGSKGSPNEYGMRANFSRAFPHHDRSAVLGSRVRLTLVPIRVHPLSRRAT